MKVSTASDRRRIGRGTVEARRRQRRRLRPNLLALEDRRLLSTFTVTSAADSAPASSPDVNTLRWAVQQANAATSASSIEIELGSSPATITLMQGQLELGNTAYPTTIYDGPGEGAVTVSGNNVSRVFQVDANVTAVISGMTVAGGRAGNGGGLYNHGGILTMTNCTVSGNSAAPRGGGLWNSGTATLTDCTFSQNSASSSGRFQGRGGGLYNIGGTLTMTNCTVSGNSGGPGGLLTRGGTLTLTNCTVSANSTHSVVSGLGSYGSTTTLNNTIVAGNTGGFQDLIGPYSGNNNLIGGDPLLAPLGNYGVTTQTMAPLPGSPAIDAGNNMLIPSGVTTDQRGLNRIVNGTVDIGAVESSGFTVAATSGSGQTAGAVFPAPLVATVTANNSAEPVAGGLVTFTPPLSGASAIISGSPALISASGTASVTAANNGFAGEYIVSATTSGAPVAAPFDLTNLALESIAVSPGNPILALGVTGQFSATGTFSDGSSADFTDLATWASTTPSVAAIGATGVASALGLGQSVITASLAGVTSPDDTLTVITPSFVVNTTADEFGFFTGTTSLREAIAGANLVPGQTITFAPTVFGSAATITLTLGELELSDATGTVAIVGPAAGVTVNAGGASRVFEIDSGVTASISGMTITGGSAYSGGGLANDGGNLTLTDCTVSGNTSGSPGFYPSSGGGAGLYNSNSGTSALSNCTISDNTAYGQPGGGVNNQGGSVTLTNCTISGNSGGGLATGSYYQPGGTTTLINCTVSGNTGAGLITGYGTTTATNTIIAGNDFDLSGSLAAASTNNLIGGNPLLAPLGDYGGTSQTMALLPGSPAIDAGTSTGAPATDQRGSARVGAVDIGAFESHGFTVATVPGSTPQSSNIGTPFANPLAVSVTANDSVEPVDGGVVSFVGNPAGGATAILLSPSAVIAGGQAAVTAAPNNALGSYTVVASGPGLSIGSFALTNTGAVFTALVVNDASDSLFPGEGLLSLREAVAFANLDSLGISSITFDPTVFFVLQTITLTGTQLELSNTTETETITGPAAGVTVDAGALSRVFQVDQNVTASISGMTITDGNTPDNGGGLLNLGTTTLTDCTFSGNTAGGTGGGVYNSGIATLNGTTFSGNYAYGGGGGLGNSGNAMLTDCSVSGNTANGSGGGVNNSGTLTLTGGDVSSNSTTASSFSGPYGSGGGVYNGGTATLSGCMISGNSTSAQSHQASGGGVAAGGAAMTTLTNCMISGNSTLGFASSGGGVFNGGGVLGVGGSTAVVNQCVITGNSTYDYGGGLADWGTVTVSGCTISDNSASNGEGGGGGVSIGSIFDNYDATATLTNCTINDNIASGFWGGGGVASWGATTLTNCTVSGNNTTKVGGGVFSSAAANGLSAPASVTLTNCTVSGNSASSGGGVNTGSGSVGQQVFASATLLNNCTVSGNSASGHGGGLATGQFGTTTAMNSTISSNTAVDGGGVFTAGSNFIRVLYAVTNLTNCTVSGNSATGTGGGLISGSLATTTLGNTIAAVNTATTSGPDALGTFDSQGHNLIGETDGSSGWVGSDLTGTIATPLNPQLGPLANYGGPTETMALLLNSPAIDAGNNTLIPAGITTDQRGFARIVNSVVDIGAVETNGIIVKGNTYNDQDGNGFHGGSEPALSGWTVNLLDSTGNVLGSVLTDSSGNFKFSGVGLGSSYQVAETVPAGWVQTQPLYPTVYSFTAQSGLNLNGLNFGDHSAPALNALAVIDNGQAGYTETGSWSNSVGGFGGSNRIARTVQKGKATATGTWDFTGLSASATYDVYVTFGSKSQYSNAAPFTVYDGSKSLGTQSINESILVTMAQGGRDQGSYGGVGWLKLGTYSLTGTELKVVLSNLTSTGSYVDADGVLLVSHGGAVRSQPGGASPAHASEVFLGVVDFKSSSTPSTTSKTGQTAATTIVLNGVSSPTPINVVYDQASRPSVNQSAPDTIDTVLGLGLPSGKFPGTNDLASALAQDPLLAKKLA